MLTVKNEFISEAAETLYKLTANDQIRRQCEDREEYYRIQRTVARDQQCALEQLEHTRSELADTVSELAGTKSELADTKSELAGTKSELADAQKQIAELQSRLAALENSPGQPQNL